VDTAYFCPAAEPATAPQVVLTGKMSYHANVTAAMQLVDDIMPRVWQRRPDVEVVIAGSAPARGVRQLARRHAPRVRVTGYVPDLRPYLRAAAVAAAPLAYGAGIQNKVLEAMACATPVVASPQASAALRARPGTDIWLADEPADFAQALLHLLDQPATRRALGAAGRAYVVAHHQWDHIVRDLEGYYDEFAGTTAEQPL
jgi:glycosyltransferase involved in cell wall biosynthesis